VGGIGFAMLKVGQALPERLKTSVETCNQLLKMQLANSKVLLLFDIYWLFISEWLEGS
jgi:hypothetical protein